MQTYGTITLLIQVDHLSLVAPSCNYCLLSIVSLRQGGTRRAVKKSVRLPAKRTGMGPRSSRQSQQWVRFHSIIVKCGSLGLSTFVFLNVRGNRGVFRPIVTRWMRTPVNPTGGPYRIPTWYFGKLLSENCSSHTGG